MSAKPWTLVAPDWASLDTIWRSPLPFVLWPVCDKALLAHWLDEAVRVGVPSVTIEAVDRPHLLRHWLDRRDMWSRTIEIRSRRHEEDAGERILMDRLPGQPVLPEPGGAKDLLVRWFDLQASALGRRDSGMVHLDHELRPGVWAGPGARVDPSAELVAPCWIGGYARVGANCRLGPNAFVGPGAYLDEDVEVSDAIICADTYVGSHTSLRKMVAQGGLLLDFEKGVAVEVVDKFVMGFVQGKRHGPTIGERALAAVLRPILEICARVAAKGRVPSTTEVQLGRFRQVALRNYPAGWLCLRRAAWLREVVRGNMRFAGVLPRTSADWERLPPEVRSALEQVPAGVFARSDLYHCHSPSEADEWTHALFQAGLPDGTGEKMTRAKLMRIALTIPL